MGLCTAVMDEVLDQLFGGSDYAEPGTYYAGLATAVAANGTITGEPSGSGYARVSITNNGTNWNTSSGGATSNKTAITFPEASGSWGTVDTWFLSSSDSGGTALHHGPLSSAKTIGDGDIPRFSAGELDISFTDSDPVT